MILWTENQTHDGCVRKGRKKEIEGPFHENPVPGLWVYDDCFLIVKLSKLNHSVFIANKSSNFSLKIFR
jgi:hypothetical protein